MATTKAQYAAKVAAKEERIQQLERQLTAQGQEPLPEGATLGKKIRHGFSRAWTFIKRCARAVGRAIANAARSVARVIATAMTAVWGVAAGVTGWAARGVKRAVLSMYAWLKDLAMRMYTQLAPRVQKIWTYIKRAAVWTGQKVRAFISNSVRQAQALVVWTAGMVGEAIVLFLKMIDGLAAFLGKTIAAIIAPTYVRIKMAQMEAQMEAQAQARAAA